MTIVKQFEDLVCWQKARELVKIIYDISKSGKPSPDYKLKKQLRSSAISTVTNITEGFARYHKKEFIHFLDISESSAAEVKSLMYFVLDQEYLREKTVLSIQNATDDVRHIILGHLRHINSSISEWSNHIKESSTSYYKINIDQWLLSNKYIAQITTLPLNQYNHLNT